MDRLFITKAENKGDLTVSLTFSDNTVRTVDIGDFIRRHPHPQYNKYLDPRKFSRFTIENGNIVWGKNWDLIFPVEHLYAGRL
jgi:hypothetical protein